VVFIRQGVSIQMDENRWLSVDEIASYLGIKRPTVYKWIDRKDMPAHKVGRLWKFKAKEIDHWVESGKAGKNEAVSDYNKKWKTKVNID